MKWQLPSLTLMNRNIGLQTFSLFHYTFKNYEIIILVSDSSHGTRKRFGVLAWFSQMVALSCWIIWSWINVILKILSASQSSNESSSFLPACVLLLMRLNQDLRQKDKSKQYLTCFRLLDYRELVKDDRFNLFVDFYKASTKFIFLSQKYLHN